MKGIRFGLSCLVLSGAFIQASARVTQHTADSIAAILNGKTPPGCDSSCTLYTAEHPGLGLFNTLFIALLVITGTIWMYQSYGKKKYILASGISVSLLIAASYFAAPLFRHEGKIPESCPVIREDKKSGPSVNEFAAPGKEFEQNTTDTLSSNKDSIGQSSIPVGGNQEFQPANGGEFKSTGGEFSNNSPEAANASPKPQQASAASNSVLNSLKSNMVIIPVVAFFLAGIISLFIGYPKFRKYRGLILLGGFIFLGFYQGACPCMISGFQNGILMLFGVPVRWETTLWFLLLIPSAYFFGRIWCGWLCHLGALQEFLFKGAKLQLLQGRKAQKIIKGVQISLFAVWILQMLITKTNVYCVYDPFKVAFNLFSATATGWILLALLLISSVLIYRPFCRAICPVGLILGWVSYLPGARKLDKNNHCVHCKACSHECKYRAMIFEDKTTTLKNEDCIMCGDCISSCKKNALQIKIKKTGISLFILVLLSTTYAHAQWECPSRLGSNLKPLGTSNLMWSSEIVSSAGYTDGLGIANLMWLGGLDYSFGKNTFYLEGGIKNWSRFGTENNNSNFLLVGLREAFYKFNGTNQNLTVGLHSMKSEDDYLINERVAGISYKASTGKLTFSLQGGTVMKEFARNGTFCTVGYLYNIVSGRERALIGTDPFQTNLAMLSLSYKPGNTESGDEFATPKQESLFTVKSVGLLAYTEFGKWIDKSPFISGIYAQTGIAGISFKPELLIQKSNNNNACIYSLNAENQHEWQNGQMTRFFARYIGLLKSDNKAVAMNSFSNIFAGEVIRLDALDLNIFQVGIKHSFTASKMSLKLQYATQTGSPVNYYTDDFGSQVHRMQEIDLSISKNLNKHWLITAYGGYLVYPDLQNSDGYLVYTTKKTPWGKVELRLTF